MKVFKRKEPVKNTERIKINHRVKSVITLDVFEIEGESYVIVPKVDYGKAQPCILYVLESDFLFEVDAMLNMVTPNKPDYRFWISD